tara:strand:- start:5196 stop:5378 length:183 start_codon:yes stop_codon:yes gene_type:complete
VYTESAPHRVEARHKGSYFWQDSRASENFAPKAIHQVDAFSGVEDSGAQTGAGSSTLHRV